MILIHELLQSISIPAIGREYLDQVPKWLQNFVSIALLRYLLIISIISVFLFRFLQRRQYISNLIDKIPGPPVHPWLPWLGHTMLVLDLDRIKYQHGTYACKIQFISIYFTQKVYNQFMNKYNLIIFFNISTILNQNQCNFFLFKIETRINTNNKVISNHIVVKLCFI